MAGVASRRKSEEIILQARVKVDGKVVITPGTKVDSNKSKIEVDGRRINPAGTLLGRAQYILLNKPKGFISAASEAGRRPVVVDLIKKVKGRLFPVGRLDYDAEGVLIITNDGELTNKLIHPRYAIEKRYVVKVSDVPDLKDLKNLERGVYLEDGRTLPAKVRFIKKTRENSWIEITVTEGRTRLIKRMCAAVGHSVLKLKRVEFAGIRLGRLKTGDYRNLEKSEVQALMDITAKAQKGAALGGFKKRPPIKKRTKK